MINRAAIILSCLLVASCLTNQIPEEAVRLKNENLLSVFSGKTVYGTLVDKQSFTEYYASDKRVVYKQGKSTLYGIWSVKEDLLCTRYLSSNTDEEHCWEIYKHGDVYIDTWPSGPHKGQLAAEYHTFEDGDVEGLMAE